MSALNPADPRDAVEVQVNADEVDELAAQRLLTTAALNTALEVSEERIRVACAVVNNALLTEAHPLGEWEETGCARGGHFPPTGALGTCGGPTIRKPSPSDTNEVRERCTNAAARRHNNAPV